MGEEPEKNSTPTTQDFFREFFSPTSWIAEGAGLIGFGIVVTLLVSGDVDFQEDWGWYAVALAFLVLGFVFWLVKGPFSRVVSWTLALASLVAVEIIFYVLVF